MINQEEFIKINKFEYLNELHLEESVYETESEDRLDLHRIYTNDY